MPEVINDRQIFSLLEVTRSIQKTIAERYKSSYWIKAELNKLNNYKQSGHCYPELVEKQNGKVVAQIRSNLWREDYLNIDKNFKRVLNEPLKDGIKILFLATISFHPEYGLSLRILDIDPSFSLGDLEKEKQETIRRLKAEDLFNRNKLLTFPVLPQRIAIISVETSKGYADFLQVFEQANKSWRYKFFHMLFPSILQGDNAVPSIIKQLNRIKRVKNHFDVVAIVRGGGEDLGLSCYNKAEEKIIDRSKRIISEEKNKFSSEVKLFRSVTNHMLLRNKNVLKESGRTIISQSHFIFRNEQEYHKNIKQKIVIATKHLTNSLNEKLVLYGQIMRKDVLLLFKVQQTELGNIEKNVNNMKPENVLKRGYSITYLNGKAVSSFSNVREGDVLNTVLNEGNITSTVNSTSKSENNE